MSEKLNEQLPKKPLPGMAGFCPKCGFPMDDHDGLLMEEPICPNDPRRREREPA